ncbi:MAG TPA: hypothetical protein VK894_06440 [Jiangellales bacterium]|nr:hypothetical protein [Jiangellales bacterium]
MADRELSTEERRLLDALRAGLAEADPVPEVLVEAAKASFTWRTVDAELAELVADTALEARAVRGQGGPRLLTFAAGPTTLVVEVDASGAGRRLLGQIVRPRRAEVEVRHAGGTVSVAADDLGRFRVDTVPAGPLSLSCRFPEAGEQPVVTSWVTV